MLGFERGDYATLSDLLRELRELFVYISDHDRSVFLKDWVDSPTLKNVERTGVILSTEDCKDFAVIGLDKIRRLGYNVRLVVCQVETGEGHLMCEIASRDYSEAYFFDNRQIKLTVKNDLKRYKFIAVSPWNLVATDTRPWLKVKA